MSDDAERSLLVKLKTECGYQFTSKLESMFTDIKTSRDMMLEYRNREQSSSSADDMEINVQASQSLAVHVAFNCCLLIVTSR